MKSALKHLGYNHETKSLKCLLDVTCETCHWGVSSLCSLPCSPARHGGRGRPQAQVAVPPGEVSRSQRPRYRTLRRARPPVPLKDPGSAIAGPPARLVDSQSQVKHLILVPGRRPWHHHGSHTSLNHLPVVIRVPRVMATYTPAASFPTPLGWAAPRPSVPT